MSAPIVISEDTAPAGDRAAPPAPASTAEVLRFTFTGSGQEYFRIWIVNLLLTILTLGIYSAWAKVRRIQYFDRNTALAGAVFDFSGNPQAILRGRLFAVVLLIAYHQAFGFSRNVGLAIVAFLMLSLPWMLRSAQRFRLTQTRYRGLRFAFHGSLRDAYLAFGPPVLTVLLPGALAAISFNRAAALSGLLYLAWPLMHGAIRRYQHGNMAFGSQRAQFHVRKRSFYRPYVFALLFQLVILVVFIALLLVFAAVGVPADFKPGSVVLMLCTAALVYVAYVVAWPYMQARIANLAWSGTTFGGVEIRCAIPPGAYVRLQVGNALLTLLTLGLFRPFALVRAYRFRMAHVTLHMAGSFATVMAATGAPGAGHADGMAEFFGGDIAW